MAVAQLLVVGIDPSADGRRQPEIEGRALDRIDPAERHEGRIDRRIAVGGDRQHMVENRMLGVARQVEIGVIGHIDHRRTVGSRLVADVDGIVVRQPVDDLRRDGARESCIAVGRMQRQGERLRIGPLCLAETILPSVGPAVQTVAEVVHRQAHRVAVEHEPSAGDAVGITADRRAEIRRDVAVIVDVVEAEHHVAQHTRAVGHHDRDDARTEIGDAHLHPLRVGQGV